MIGFRENVFLPTHSSLSHQLDGCVSSTQLPNLHNYLFLFPEVPSSHRRRRIQQSSVLTRLSYGICSCCVSKAITIIQICLQVFAFCREGVKISGTLFNSYAELLAKFLIDISLIIPRVQKSTRDTKFQVRIKFKGAETETRAATVKKSPASNEHRLIWGESFCLYVIGRLLLFYLIL